MEALEKWTSSGPSPPITRKTILTALEAHNMEQYARRLKMVVQRGRNGTTLEHEPDLANQGLAFVVVLHSVLSGILVHFPSL